MKKAMFFELLDNNRVVCSLCPRRCTISEGKTGFCGVRKNLDGTLFALTYNRIASVAVDPVEKKPLYHFHPGIMTLSVGTFGCNLRCRHCQNWELSHHILAVESDTGMYDINPEELVALAEKRDCEAIAWTYNEPGIWIEYILESARLAKKSGILTILVTAGFINPAPLKELLNFIDAYRLDVKGFSDRFYQEITGEKALALVLENGAQAFRSGAHVEIVTNIIPGLNDSDGQLSGVAGWIASSLSIDTPWHVTAYHPANKLSNPPTPVSTLERAKKLGAAKGLRYIYIGNIHDHPGQNTVCPGCLKLLIARDGFSILENNIVNAGCGFCGCKIGVFRDSPLQESKS